MPLVAVVIPTWNGLSLLQRCLASLYEQSFDDFEILVVDNHSLDGTVAWLAETYPEVRVIVNQANLGFALAINQGIRASSSRYVVTLNNDTQVAPGWLAALVAAAEGNARVGSCASKMLFAHRPQMVNSAGICLDRVGIAWDRLGGTPDDPEERALLEIFGPCAGAALYRRAMLDEIGLFDEDFFAYMEDVDLAWRARSAGWISVFVPQARVLHHHSATGKEGSPFKNFQLGRNKVWLIVKNYPVRQLWYYLPLVILYDLAAVLFALLSRRDIHALRGRLAGLWGFVKMWRKRLPPHAGPRLDVVFLSPPVWPWQVPLRYRHIAEG